MWSRTLSFHRLSEDDFVDRLLLDNVPVNGLAGPVESPQHRGITRVLNGGIKIGLDEVEEGLEVGVTAVFGLLFPALCDFAQERQNFVGCDGAKIPVFAEVIKEFGERLGVGPNRIFFPNSSCGTPDRPELPVRVSWLASCFGCGCFPDRSSIREKCKISTPSVQQFDPRSAFKYCRIEEKFSESGTNYR